MSRWAEGDRSLGALAEELDRLGHAFEQLLDERSRATLDQVAALVRDLLPADSGAASARVVWAAATAALHRIAGDDRLAAALLEGLSADDRRIARALVNRAAGALWLVRPGGR